MKGFIMNTKKSKTDLKENSYLVNSTHACRHCGNKGLMNYIGKTGWMYISENEDIYGNIFGSELLEHMDYYIFECPVCYKPVIISEHCLDINDEVPKFEVEYPSINISSEGVPNKIYSAFESAIKTKGIDYSICLLSLRRVLEMICNDKGAQGKTLENKIKNLVESKLLPEMIGDACWIIRQLGNEAAHSDKIEVYSYDVEQVIGYVGTIIDYLYSMPQRINSMKETIIKRKSQNGSE